MLVKEIADYNCPLVPEACNLKELIIYFQKVDRTTLPVVNGNNLLVGIISLHDVIRCLMPKYLDLMPSVEFLGTAKVLERHLLNQILDPITGQLFLVYDVMVKKPTFVQETDSTFKALALMIQRNYHHLPVVNKDKVCLGMVDQKRIILSFLSSFR